MTVQETALQRAIGFLKASQAQYRIVLDDGREIVSDGFPKDEPRIKRHSPGTLSKLYMPVMQDMQPGDIGEIRIPGGEDAGNLQAAVGAHAGDRWGSGNYLTQLDRAKGVVYVVRGA